VAAPRGSRCGGHKLGRQMRLKALSVRLGNRVEKRIRAVSRPLEFVLPKGMLPRGTADGGCHAGRAREAPVVHDDPWRARRPIGSRLNRSSREQ
jgi:hypothetical protein